MSFASPAAGRKWFWKGCKPISVCASCDAERIICLSSQYPEPVPPYGTWSGPLQGPLFGLAPDGVFRASALTLGAVGSYPTFSPLPRPRCQSRGGLIFCGTIRRGASRRRLPRVSYRRPSCVGPGGLRGIAPCGVRTFLLPRIAPGKAILRPSKIALNIPWRPSDDKLSVWEGADNPLTRPRPNPYRTCSRGFGRSCYTPPTPSRPGK